MPKNPYYDDIDLPMHLDVGYHISEEADHSLLYNREKEDQHPISAITGLEDRLEEIEMSGSKLPAGGSEGQVLAKNSDEDFDLVWKDVKSGGDDDDYTGYYDEIKKLGAYRYETFYHVLDYRHAYEYYETTRDVPKPCGCSSVKSGNFYGRSFDWYYDETAEFVVHTPRIANRYASVGISPGFTNILTEEFVESGEYSDYYRLVPFNLVDGINEHGLVCNTNVVPTDFGPSRVVPTKESEVTINGMMIVRYLLDHFKTAKEAVEFIQEHMTVYFSKDIHDANYELHLMVADADESYVVEFIGRRAVIFKDQDKMTKFYIHAVDFNADGTVYTPETQDAEHDAITTNRVTKNGSGLERYNLIVDNFDSANTAEGMRNLLKQLTYTRAYKSSKDCSDPYWFTEFVGAQELTCASEPEEFEYVVDKADQYYRNRERGDHKTWHTVHSSVFDINKRTMTVIFQEGNKEIKFEVESASENIKVDNISIKKNSNGEVSIGGFEEAANNTSPTKVGDTIEWRTPEDRYLPTDIHDPKQNQVLLYEEETEKWTNKDLTDENSIIYVDEEAKGLSIKGYNEAKQGQMLVKDQSRGLAWVNPVSDKSLREAVQEANAAAGRSSASAIESANQAVLSGLSADDARDTLKEVNRKIWFGTKAEYNALEVVYDDSIYIILDED